MHLVKIFSLLSMSLFLSLNAISQDARIIEMMNEGNYKEAADILSTGNSIEDMDYDNLSALGLCYIELKNYTDAETVYAELTGRKKARIRDYAYYGEILLINRKYDKSKEAFKFFLEENPDNINARLKLESCDSLKTWENHETDVSLESPENINSPYEERSSLIIDEKLVIVSNRIPETYRNKSSLSENDVHGYLILKDSLELFQEDLLEKYTCQAMDYCSEKDMMALTLRKKKKFMVETDFLPARIYFRHVNSDSDSLILFDWDNSPEDINIAHPAFSKNGERLYFTSDMPGGEGENDLYYSDLVNNKWTEPVNLGPEINTAKNDLFPVIQGDTVLYYASDGMPGYGNLDVFMAKINDDIIGKPENMKAPINSRGHDYSYYKTDEYSGYLTSNRSSMSMGMHDIFRHERPEPVIVEEEPEEEPEEEILVFKPENFKPEPVYFDINKDELDDAYSSLLRQIADTLKTYEEISLCITGHSDTKGPASFSEKLAAERTETVKSKLMEMGVDSDRLTIKSAGITKDRDVDGINYHVQIGSSKADDAKNWYENKLDNKFEVNRHKNGDYYVYTVGSCNTKAEAKKLKDTLENTHEMTGLIGCSSRGKLLANCFYALNRRVEFSWKK